MNKTISLAAIAMVAVIMGMSAFAPAMASPNDSGPDKHNPKELACHFDRDTNDDLDETTNDRAWEVMSFNKHSMIAHLAHGDIPIDDGVATDLPTSITSADCGNQVAADPDL